MPASQSLASSGGKRVRCKRARRSVSVESGIEISKEWKGTARLRFGLRADAAQLAAERDQVAHVELGLLERGEVAATRHLGPALHVERALREAARRDAADVFREQRHRDRSLHAIRGRERG